MIFSKIKSKINQLAWERQYQIPKHLDYIETLYQDSNGFELSTEARKNAPNLDLTYGEINLYSFLALMSLAKPQQNTIFYDLGSGLGKTVLAFTACYHPHRAYGIETLNPLHVMATTKISSSPYADKIHLLHQDILDTNFKDASLIFINVATFIPDTWQQIEKKLQQIPVETIITCAKPLTHYDKIHSSKVQTSWGVIPAYIHTQSK